MDLGLKPSQMWPCQGAKKRKLRCFLQKRSIKKKNGRKVGKPSGLDFPPRSWLITTCNLPIRPHLEYHSVPTSLKDMLWLLYQWPQGFKNRKLYATRMVVSGKWKTHQSSTFRATKEITIPWWSTPISGNYGFTDVARVFLLVDVTTLLTCLTKGWERESPFRRTLWPVQTLYSVYQRIIKSSGRVFLDQQSLSQNEPKMYSNKCHLQESCFQTCSFPWKVSKQTTALSEHHNHRASACSPDFSHQKEHSSNKHHRHHKDTGSLAPATDLRGRPTWSPFPFTETSILSPCHPCSRYPISGLHSYPAAWVLESTSNSSR